MRYHCSFSSAGVRENSTIIFPIPTPDNSSFFSNRSHSDLSICSFVVAEATSPRCSSVTISSSAILPGALTALINHSFSTLRRIPVAIDQHNEVIATATAMAIIILFTSLSANVSGHRRRLVRRTVQRLVQLFHFAWSRRLSPENWCWGVENGAFFGFGDDFGVFWVIFRRKTSTFPSFFVAASHLRRGVEVLGITPHLLNVRAHRTAHFVRRTVQPIVGSFLLPPCRALQPFSSCHRHLCHC